MGVRTITIEGKEYYEVYEGVEVGKLFSDWRDIGRYEAKLKQQIKRSKEITKQYENYKTLF